MSQATTDIDAAIQELSDAFGTPEGELRKKFEQYREGFADKDVSDPDQRALRRLSLDEKGGSRSSSRGFRGVVLGAGDPYDTTQKKIQRARNFIEKRGPQEASKHGLVKKADGEPKPGLASITLTNDEGDELHLYVLEANENSPNHGEVLPEEDWIRFVYGYVLDDGEWYPFETILNGEDMEPPAVPPTHVPVEFQGSVSSSSGDSNTTSIRVDGAGDFEPVETGFSFEDLLGDAIPVLDLEDVDADEYGRDDLVATQGAVTYMELSPGEDQNRRVVITDPYAFSSDKQVTCFVPDHVEIDFQEEADVYVFGNVSPPSSEEYDESINAVGLYADPEAVVDMEIESFADGDFAVDEADEPESGESEAEGDSEPDEPKGDGDDGPWLPDPAEIAEEDDYSALQGLASGFDDIPGSGLTKEELRKKLVAKANQRQQEDGDDGPEPADQESDEPDPDEEASEPDEDEDWEW